MNPLLPNTPRHEVTVATALEKLQRVARELRETEHPAAALAQQTLGDLAWLFRKHLEKPCPHWSGMSELPGEPL